jgi:hypothetical protein
MPVDPLLNTRVWRKTRERMRLTWMLAPCARCGQPIDYSLKHPHPGSLVCGHRVGRAEATRRGWTIQQIHDPSNLQPEHRACSNSSVAIQGNKSPRRRLKAQRLVRPATVNRPDAEAVQRARETWAELFPGEPYDPDGDWWT